MSIDFTCYQVNSSKNYLLVSDETKQESNQNKISEDLRGTSFSEYFPSCDNLLELLEKIQLKKHISSLICSDKAIDDFEILNYPAQIVLGILQAKQHNDDTVEVILKQANDSANPAFCLYPGEQKLAVDHFKIPDWLTQYFKNPSTVVQFRIEHFKLSARFTTGFEILVPLDVLYGISEDQIKQLPKNDVKALVNFLSTLAAVALNETAEKLAIKESIPDILS